MQLHEKVAVVTGAGRGLGRAVVRRLAREGAYVAAISRRKNELEDLASDIASWGGQCLPVPGDVSSSEEMLRIAHQVERECKGVDILINNAAVIGPAQFSDPFESWRQALEINLIGAANCIHSFLPLLLEAAPGSVINVSSGLARMALPRFSAYCTSKAGLEHLSRCLAEEFGAHTLRVACLDPGVMDTDMQAEIRDQGPDKLGSQLWNQFSGFQSSGQLRDPESVAELALALAKHIPQDRNGESFSMQDLQRLQKARPR